MEKSTQNDETPVQEPRYFKENLIEDYVEFVKKQADNRTNVIFNNSSIAHSVVIAENMFNIAEKSIKILSGTLSGIYYSKVKTFLMNAAKRINKDGAIKIITIDETDNEKIKKLDDDFKNINKELGKDVIKYIALDYKAKHKEIAHFYVIDSQAWRIEKPHNTIKDNNEEVKARVCFNDKEIGTELSNNYDTVWGFITN